MMNFIIFGVPYLKEGSGIHIKKQNRGKFTEYCGGKVTDECILKAKKSNNPVLRKRAVFAENSKRWTKKHEGGGELQKAKENTINWITNWYKQRRKLNNSKINNLIDFLYDNMYSGTIPTLKDIQVEVSSDFDENSKHSAGGRYNRNKKHIYLKPYYQKVPWLLTHEYSHHLNSGNPLIYNLIGRIIGDKIDDYWMTPGEVHSRLMSFRQLNNIDPTKIYNLKDIQELRKNGKDMDLLNRFTDQEMVDLLNNVAMNDDVLDNNSNLFAKKGSKIHKPFGHRSVLDNGWLSTTLLKNKKNVIPT